MDGQERVEYFLWFYYGGRTKVNNKDERKVNYGLQEARNSSEECPQTDVCGGMSRASGEFDVPRTRRLQSGGFPLIGS